MKHARPADESRDSAKSPWRNASPGADTETGIRARQHAQPKTCRLLRKCLAVAKPAIVLPLSLSDHEESHELFVGVSVGEDMDVLPSADGAAG
jgi:hypothetical protein